MILENGVIRTMDSSLPLARSLAIAGDRVAGGVGNHETALPGPERVDLGGRCVLPGFTDAHVHFPTWAVAQDEVRLPGNGPPGAGAPPALAGRGARPRARGAARLEGRVAAWPRLAERRLVAVRRADQGGAGRDRL